MNETQYRRQLEKTITNVLRPPTLILRNNPKEIQGIPDIIVLNGERWAMLEIKDDINAPVQANQPYYIDMCDSMAFGAFIYPQNEDEVIEALIRYFNQR